jgi:hypothetical protein
MPEWAGVSSSSNVVLVVSSVKLDIRREKGEMRTVRL